MLPYEPNKGIAEELTVELDSGYNVRIVDIHKSACFTRDEAIASYISFAMNQDPYDFRWRIFEQN